MVLAGPVVAPDMSPAEMRAEEWHEYPIALALVVVRAEPVEAAVERDVPGVAQSTRNNLQIGTHVVASQHAPLASPVISGILVRGLVLLACEHLRCREIGCALGCAHIPEIPKGLGCHAPGLRQALGRAMGEIELPVRRPVVPMVRMLEIPKVRKNLYVFVRHVVAVEVAHDCEIGRVADPEVAAVPCEPLDRVQPGGERFGRVGKAVTVRVDEDHDGVAGRIRLGVPILRSLADEEAPTGVERHGARVTHHGLPGKELCLQLGRDGRERGVTARLAERERRGRGCNECQRGQGRTDGVLHGMLHRRPHRRTVSGGRRRGGYANDLRVVSGAHQIAIMPRA